MSSVPIGLMIKIDRATQTARQQIIRSIIVDETREAVADLSLEVAESIGVNKLCTITAGAATEILQRTTTISDIVTAISSSIATSTTKPVISAYEISDVSTTPIISPTPILLSLFDISEIKGGQ